MDAGPVSDEAPPEDDEKEYLSAERAALVALIAQLDVDSPAELKATVAEIQDLTRTGGLRCWLRRSGAARHGGGSSRACDTELRTVHLA
jgi:hypothetical protein